MSIAGLFFILGVAAAAPARASTMAAPAADAVLQGLIDEGLAHNPELLAAQQLEKAAGARPVQVGSRPGPTVGVFYQNDGVAPSLGREPMTMLGLSAGQEIPYPGKLGLRRSVAEADARLAGFEVDRARLSLVAAIKRAYYDLVLARGLADLALQHRKVWDEVRETARAQYASTLGSQPDLVRAQLEATRVQALHAQHHAEARARVAEINSLIGRALDTPIETPGALALAREARTPAEIVRWAEGVSPELTAAQAVIARDERALELARLGSKPDFNVQGALINRGGLPPMWQASASVLLPSRARAKGALAEAEARLTADKAALEAVRLRLHSAVEQRLAFLSAAEEIAATYRDGLLQQGDVAVESVTAAYAAGQGSQLAVLAAVAAVLEDRTDYLRVVAAHQTELARLGEASLEPPMAVDSLLMHGRSTTTGGGSMGIPTDSGARTARPAMAGAQPEMR